MCNMVSKHASFYMESVTFLVENCLFKVPREPFETESIVFRDMFLLPTGEGHEEEGKCDDNPIHLMGIKKDELEQLLRVLLHRTYSKCQKLPSEIDTVQWNSILKLANIWGFDAVREVALDHLKSRVSLAERVALGELYDLDFESWSLPAMHELVRRRKPVSFEEGQLMGLDTTLKLVTVREQILSRLIEGLGYGRPNAEGRDYRRIIRETFKPPPPSG